MQPGYPPPGYYPPPPRKSGATTVIIVLACVFGGIMVLGILAAVAIPSFLKYRQKAKTSDAELRLKEAAHGVKAYYMATGQLPQQSSGLTPPVSCCEFGTSNHKCPVDMSAWELPPWSDIGFEVDEETYFQFQYEVSGDRYTVRAVGDLDCDGTTAEWTISGTGDGPMDLTEPSHPD
jgi:type II secretory pathway pseudopilin PulG